MAELLSSLKFDPAGVTIGPADDSFQCSRADTLYGFNTDSFAD